MTVFPFPWDATFESEPADNELRSIGASRIRDLKNAIAARMVVDHSFAGDANDGKHVQVELRVAAADPSLDPTDGCVYTKVVSGNTELFYKDSSGTVLQITTVGALNTGFASGTKLMFPQAAPPTGWTQVNTWNDVVPRVIDHTGTGGATGGTWDNSIGLTLNIAGHQLVASEIPSHTHNFTIDLTPNTTTAQGGGGVTVPIPGASTYTTDAGTGGNGFHGHAGSTVSSGSSWRPAYVNSIVASKN